MHKSAKIMCAMWATLLLMLACCTAYASASCQFPEYVQQSITTPRDWRGRIREQNTEVSLRITFDRHKMEVVSTDSFGRSMTRHCRQAYGSSTFLVAHEERNSREGRYTCMEFVRRGNGILQIREAELSETIDRSLCSESNLKYDAWLVIDMINAITNREACSIRGGFDINVYDKSNFRGVCDAYQGETRLESECLPGEGLTFQFRKTTCVPDGLYMYAEQNTVCLASWAQGKWSFILLKHDKLDYMWVLRYPNNLVVDRFTAHLFKDLYASNEGTPTDTYNYLHMAMIRNRQFDLDSLCMDEYEICTALKEPCGINQNMVLTCPMRCGLCNSTKPITCNFDREYRGMWADAAHFSHTAEVSIDTHSLTVQSTETLRCVQWSSASAVRRSGQHTEEMMLVSDSTGGCRPRYSCAKLTRINQGVMFIHISQPRLWPLTKHPNDPIDCSDFVYDSDRKHKDTNKLRDKHSVLLVRDRYDKKVECDLSRFRRFNVLLQSGIRCAGELRQNTKKNNLHFDLQNCEDQTLKNTFDCIEYDRYPPSNDLLLITRTQGSKPVIHCWIFPKRPANIFHLIPATQCNENAKRRIRKERLGPLATFTKPNPHMRTKSASSSEVEPTGRINLTVAVMRDAHPVEFETEPTFTYDVEHNDTMTSQQEVSETSPFVIAAVIVTMMVMQLSLLCACRCT